VQYLCFQYPLHQWRRKIVEFRGAEARRHAALQHVSALLILNCLLQWIHPTILCYCLGCTQVHFHQTQANYQLLHFFQSHTCLLVWRARVKNDATVTCDQIKALTELSYSKLCYVNSLWGIFSWKSRFDLSMDNIDYVVYIIHDLSRSASSSWKGLGVYGSNIKGSSYFNKQSVLQGP